PTDPLTLIIDTLSLPDALPISPRGLPRLPERPRLRSGATRAAGRAARADGGARLRGREGRRLRSGRLPRGGRPEGARRAARGDLDRKSTRLNSSHGSISYAVFC